MRILYIDIDSLRPDHLGCYGYHRPTSPHIDSVAREGVIFHRYHTSDAPCLPSRTAFYTGRFGIQTGVVGHGGTASTPKVQGPGRGFVDSIDQQGLARQLQSLGYRTSMISTFGQRHAAHWYYAGFNEIHNTGQRGMESAEEVWPTVDTWLKAHAAKDSWYLHVNFWDPHTPYRVPAEVGDPFASSPLPAWLTDDVFKTHLQTTGPHTAQDIAMYDGEAPAGAKDYPRHPWTVQNRADLRKLIDGYDTGVLYADEHIGRVIQQLKAAGVYEETAIIISADHGENLGELGIYAEHGTADIPTTRVPLIVKWPGGRKGEDHGLHYNVDFAPTLTELLGGKAQPLWDGESFADVIKGPATSHGREQLIFGQCAHVAQRSVLWDRWLYIRTYHDGFRLLPQELLFDVVGDPFEQHDLAPTRPELVREGAWRLARWHDEQMQKMARHASDVVDPLWTVIREGGPYHARLTGPGDPGSIQGFTTYLKRLEATGRGDGAAALRKRYAAALGTNA